MTFEEIIPPFHVNPPSTVFYKGCAGLISTTSKHSIDGAVCFRMTWWFYQIVQILAHEPISDDVAEDRDQHRPFSYAVYYSQAMHDENGMVSMCQVPTLRADMRG